MKTGISVNTFGTAVSTHVCDTCGDDFTVCPPRSEAPTDNCLATTCPSYDLARDIDLFWGLEMTDGTIRREPIEGDPDAR